MSAKKTKPTPADLMQEGPINHDVEQGDFPLGLRRLNRASPEVLIERSLGVFKPTWGDPRHTLSTWRAYQIRFGEGRESSILLTPVLDELSDAVLENVPLRHMPNDDILNLWETETDRLLRRSLLISISDATDAIWTGPKGIVRLRDYMDLDEKGKPRTFTPESERGSEIARQEIYGRVYTLEPPIPKDEFRRLLDEHGSAWDLIHKAAWYGFKRRDETVTKIILAHILEVNPKRIDPGDVLPSAPHSILLTGSGAGKSRLAQDVTGDLIENPSVGGLLGQSDLNTKFRGVLNGRRRSAFVDEFHMMKDRDVAGGLQSYMESGRVVRPRGQGNRLRGWAALSFMSNPREEQTSDLDADRFERMWFDGIRVLGESFEALARRLGAVVYFNPDSESAELESNPESEETASSASRYFKMLYRAVAEYLRNMWTQALREPRVVAWLEQEYPQEHVQTLRKIAAQAQINDVKEWIRGTEKSYRHARGFALRVAFLRLADSEYEKPRYDEKDLERLLDFADEELEWVLHTQRESLSRLITITRDEELEERLLAGRLRSSGTQAHRRFIYSVIEAAQNTGSLLELGDDISLVDLESWFDRVRDVHNIKWDSGMFGTWKRVRDYVLKDDRRLNEEMKTFGLEYRPERESVRVRDLVLFRKTVKAYGQEFTKSDASGASVTSDVSVTSGVSVTSDISDISGKTSTSSRNGEYDSDDPATDSDDPDITDTLIRGSRGKKTQAVCDFLASKGQGEVFTLDEAKADTGLDDVAIREEIASICGKGDVQPHHSGADIWEVL